MMLNEKIFLYILILMELKINALFFENENEELWKGYKVWNIV